MREPPGAQPEADANAAQSSAGKARAVGACACGTVRLEIATPAVWAWHDHSEASRRAQGCAYATYVGVWRSRFRVLAGSEAIRRYEEPATGAARSFCGRCGSPLIYERPHAPKMVNLPRALFDSRTGREPRYHVGFGEAADWTWRGETLSPMKAYPGVMHARPKRPPRARIG